MLRLSAQRKPCKSFVRPVDIANRMKRQPRVCPPRRLTSLYYQMVASCLGQGKKIPLSSCTIPATAKK
ncbi:hypothetical protein AGMMS49974_02030 [Deltaproteobacteria bacterium]|nr:hypothetical protein AGMMS49974_02030 [Deltaproteobacteria bacterium]